MYPRAINILKTRSFFLFGARATGKSTLLQRSLKEEEAYFVDLLNPRVFEHLQAYPADLTAMMEPHIKAGKLIVIDEVQRVPALLDVAHMSIQRQNAVFALTGSSARKLKRGAANLLAGRASVYRLFPLLFSELGNDFSLNSAMRWGTLPELCLLKTDEEKSDFLQAYADTYVQEEVIAEQIVRNLPPFRRFLQAAAQMNTKVINAASIAADISTDPSNVRNYFEIIEDTLLGFKLDAFHASIRKSQRISPKFYWFDNGVARALHKQLNININPSTSYYGDLFESFIVTQIRAALEYRREQYQMSYLRTKDGAEIDLIVERAGSITLCIEIKSATNVRAEQLTNLSKLSADISGSKPVCLYNGKERLKFGSVDVLPWEEGLWECELGKKPTLPERPERMDDKRLY